MIIYQINYSKVGSLDQTITPQLKCLSRLQFQIFLHVIVVNFDVKIIYVYLLDGAVMATKIALMERMRRTVLPLHAPTTNLIAQKVGRKVHQNVSKKVNCATEKGTAWTELMNEKLVVS